MAILNVLEDSPTQWTIVKEEGLKDALQDGTTGINTNELQIGGVSVTATATELNYVDGVTSAIQDQLNAKFVTASAGDLAYLDQVDLSTSSVTGYLSIGNIVTSTNASSTTYLRGDGSWATPAGGTTYDYARTETAGESLTAGDVCYLKSDGKYWKADASAESTSSQDLLIATESISADASGTFGEAGYKLTTSGLTAGSNYYVSETAGEYTLTAPSTSAAIIRPIGTALSTTVLKFNPATTWVELT